MNTRILELTKIILFGTKALSQSKICQNGTTSLQKGGLLPSVEIKLKTEIFKSSKIHPRLDNTTLIFKNRILSIV